MMGLIMGGNMICEVEKKIYELPELSTVKHNVVYNECVKLRLNFTVTPEHSLMSSFHFIGGRAKL